MKKIAIYAIVLFTLLSTTQINSYAEEAELIKDPQVILSSGGTPRIEIRFTITEPINLAQGKSDIIIEFYEENENSEFDKLSYRKDKSWAGYLNSYDNYPQGMQKYSSGDANEDYPDNIPAVRLYTSTNNSASIEVMKVAAMSVTVLRADGTGEKVFVYTDGTTIISEKIGATVEEPTEAENNKEEPTEAEDNKEEVAESENSNDNGVSEKDETPKTGTDDFLNFAIVLAVLSSVGIIAFRKKRNDMNIGCSEK